MKIDVHQHLWTEPLVRALTERTEFPFVRREHGLLVLFLADERPYVIVLRSEHPEQRKPRSSTAPGSTARSSASRARWASSGFHASSRAR